jgi:phosphoserine phosphatase
MDNKNLEIIQVNIYGADKPGLTSALTSILAKHNAFVLDIGQANIHESLTFGILFLTDQDRSGLIMKELLFKASSLGVHIRFKPVSEEEYNYWVGRQGKDRYIVTLLGRSIDAQKIADVTKVLYDQGFNIDAIKRLTGRVPILEEERKMLSCIEVSVRGDLSEDGRAQVQAAFMKMSRAGLDVSFQKDDIYPLNLLLCT